MNLIYSFTNRLFFTNLTILTLFFKPAKAWSDFAPNKFKKSTTLIQAITGISVVFMMIHVYILHSKQNKLSVYSETILYLVQ